MTIILFISFVWSFLEGKREAQYFHYKWSLPNPTIVKDEHFEFTLQRFLYILFSALTAYLLFGYLGIISFFTISLTFPFFHDGSYYLRRNQLNNKIFNLKWKDSSDTTTAKISLNYKNRKILFITGFVISLICDLYLIIF
jgi:hypothetical protein